MKKTKDHSARLVPFGGDILLDGITPPEQDPINNPSPLPPSKEIVVPLEEDTEDENHTEDEFEPVQFLEEDEEDESPVRSKKFQELTDSEYQKRHARFGRIVQESLDIPHPGMIVTATVHTVASPCGCALNYRRILIPESTVNIHSECKRVHSHFPREEDEVIFDVLAEHNPHRAERLRQLKVQRIESLKRLLESAELKDELKDSALKALEVLSQ